MGTIGADCSRVDRAMTPGPPPQPHGWVRLGLEVSRFFHFLGWRSGHVPRFPRVWSSGLFSSIFFSTSLNKKNLMYLLAINQALPYGCSVLTYGHPGGSGAGDITIIWNDVLNWSID